MLDERAWCGNTAKKTIDYVIRVQHNNHTRAAGVQPAHSGLTMWFVWVRSPPCECTPTGRSTPRRWGLFGEAPTPCPPSLQAEGTTMSMRVDKHDHEKTSRQPSGTGQQSPPLSDPPGRGKKRVGRFDPQQERVGEGRNDWSIFRPTRARPHHSAW